MWGTSSAWGVVDACVPYRALVWSRCSCHKPPSSAGRDKVRWPVRHLDFWICLMSRFFVSLVNYVLFWLSVVLGAACAAALGVLLFIAGSFAACELIGWLWGCGRGGEACVGGGIYIYIYIYSVACVWTVQHYIYIHKLCPDLEWRRFLIKIVQKRINIYI